MRRLGQLVQHAPLDVRPNFVVEFGSVGAVSEKILEVAERLKIDVMTMGFHRSTHFGAAFHMHWATAYEAVCGASCPVLSVRSEYGDPTRR